MGSPSEEIPDSEDESSLSAGKVDERAASTTTTSTTPTAPTAPTPTVQAVSRVHRTENKALSAPSPRATGLQEKISQLQLTIEHTRRQLCDTLDTISANEQAKLPTAPTPKASALATYPLSDLSPEHQQSLIHAQTILDQHIKQLGKYNHLKDIAMGMLGIVADREGKTMRETMATREIEDDE